MSKSYLVLAALMLIYGTLVLRHDRVTFIDGVHQISGLQARLVGAISLLYAGTIVVMYLRKDRTPPKHKGDGTFHGKDDGDVGE
ncbi:MAG: hypothetical protein QOC70_1534 [Verrucomicrobiota bacterium]|jgi:hypothetical protein